MAPKQPSNKDLQSQIKELDRSLRSEIGSLGNIVIGLQTMVNKLDDDLVERRAVARYQREHPESAGKGGDQWLNKELIKIILGIIGLAAAIVAWRTST